MKKLALLFAALFCLSGFTTAVNAFGINIEVGISRITSMGRATGRVELTGAGFPGIGPGVTTIKFGSTDTTGPADDSAGVFKE